MMKLLAIDPSSTSTGYAVLSKERQLLDAGVLRPIDSKALPVFRISNMVDDLDALLIEAAPDVAVIETTTGKVAGRKRRRSLQLGVYGMAVGAMLVVLMKFGRANKMQVWSVRENVWTAGARKEDRSRVIRAEFPQVDWAKDRGMDVSDAIDLGLWFLARFKLDLCTGGQRLV